MKYKVGILDGEYSYSKSLMEYINYNYSDYMCMVVFGNTASLREYLKWEDMDLLLVNERAADEINTKLPLVYIVEDRARCGRGRIFKYQSAHRTAEGILAAMEKQRQISYEKRKFIGVYSPIGRCGKTELSLGLCRYGSNSLYVGLENNPNVERYIHAGFSLEKLKDISRRFMYYLATENSGIADLIEEMPLLDGFKAIAIMGGAKDIGIISSENILWLKEVLINNNKFSRVIFDIGIDVLKDTDIFHCFDGVYILQLSDDSSIGKLRLFAAENEQLINGLGDKLRYIYAPDTEYGTEQMSSFIKEYEL